MSVGVAERTAIGARVRHWRETAGLTRAALAERVAAIEAKAGVGEGKTCSGAVIAHVESGEYGCSVKRLCAISEALGKTAQALVAGIL